MNFHNLAKWLSGFTMAAGFSCLALAGPLGELEFRGDVRLTQMGSDTTLTLTNTTYLLFSGDRVATGSDPAVLRMGAGNHLGLSPYTELTLTLDGGALQADLDRGSLAYLLSDNGMTVRVNGVEVLSAGRLGMIERLEPGSLRRVREHEADTLAAASGFRTSSGNLSVSCEDSRGCRRARPRSISHGGP